MLFVVLGDVWLLSALGQWCGDLQARLEECNVDVNARIQMEGKMQMFKLLLQKSKYPGN